MRRRQQCPAPSTGGRGGFCFPLRMRRHPVGNILGSFFPAWLISIVIGVVLTVLSRQAVALCSVNCRHGAHGTECGEVRETRRGSSVLCLRDGSLVLGHRR